MLVTLLVTLLVAVGIGQAQMPDDPEGRAMLQKARRTIEDYHAGQPKSDAVLRVVYFHPSDRDPLPNYAERLDRVLGDVSDFYRDGLQRFGLANEGLPLERKDGRLVLHVVRGKSPASAYNYESGNETAAEIRAALKETFDIDREHVLVIYGLCREEPDGRYVFDAPYYGSGTQRSGLCHAADCELLDPRLLKETEKKVVFTEHYYPRVEKTVAGFNNMYLGGLAHELGHGLGLFHDAGSMTDEPYGTSLMGTGNLSYRSDVDSGDGAAFLARASALHLISHPFFTGSNRGRWEEIGGGVESLTFTPERDTLRIRGKVTGTIAPYAVVAYVWNTRQTDHHARCFPVALTDDTFDLAVTGLRPDSYFMRLTSLHVNGGTTREDHHFGFDATGTPETPRQFKWPWVVARAEKAILQRETGARDLLADEAIARAPAGDQRLLRVLRGVLEPVAPVDLATATGESVGLSDARWSGATVGWGQVARNYNWFDEKIQDGIFLTLGGQIFEKGLYAHAPSRFVFDLDSKWKTFTATVGLRDGAADQGSAVFRVLGDGKDLYRSPVLRVGNRAEVRVGVADVKKLELTAEGGEGHNHNAWSIWAEPAVGR